jgi:hypothetical protein
MSYSMILLCFQCTIPEHENAHDLTHPDHFLLSWNNASLRLEVLALRHQVVVLKRQNPKRPMLRFMERIFWVWLSRCIFSISRRTASLIRAAKNRLDLLEPFVSILFNLARLPTLFPSRSLTYIGLPDAI